MGNTVVIFSLPEEVLVLVFLELGLQSLVHCKRVRFPLNIACRHFWHTFKNSVLLQYWTELQESCMYDPLPDCEASSAQSRLEKLRAHRRVWSAFSWSDPEVIGDCRDAVCWAFIGDVLAIGRSGRVVCRQIGSASAHVPPRTWMVGHPMRDYSIAIDPAQDLLVVVGNAEEGSSTKVIFFKLSTGARHPAAYGDISVYEENEIRADRIDGCQVHGSRLGVLLRSHQPTSVLKIWDWTSGELIFDLHMHILWSFSFLPGDLVLLALLPDNSDVTQLFICDLSSGTFAGRRIVLNKCADNSQLPHICKFRFFAKDEEDVEMVSVRPIILPSQSPVSRAAGDISSFLLKPESQLLAVTIHLDRNGRINETTTLIPLSTIMEYVDRARSASVLHLEVRWDEGVPSGAHKLHAVTGFGRQWECESTYGTRFACLYQISRGRFEPRDSHLDMPPEVIKVNGEWRCTHNQIAEEPEGVHGRCADILLPRLPDGKRWEKVLLGAEAMVVISDGREDGLGITFGILTLQGPEAKESACSKETREEGMMPIWRRVPRSIVPGLLA
ncbi:hypothetical protein CONPUDRAFT_144942 [Coniophora puteana RWD-64-598 SS2]|uniref:F-box domain-containing protein n=1 Tax=Coniophora puteana (strain RWD-64-598) TaxID=741705 RepID=A0A5M3MMH1_CONPW|nr:uncharacterized protein CONPUDRAFT_144942 [Coniophora puteana RWD-64-598 SS2]EIW79791.1 hypothetical protein CONPUDRAFT_144942 [Coniophora puteana RWD-64-598 SS2]